MLEYIFLPFDRLFLGAFWLCGGNRHETGHPSAGLAPLPSLGAILLLIWVSALFYGFFYAPGLAGLARVLNSPAAAGKAFEALVLGGVLRTVVGTALISVMGVAAFGAMRLARTRVVRRLERASAPGSKASAPGSKADAPGPATPDGLSTLHMPHDIDAARALFFFLDNSLLLLLLLCGDLKLAFPADLAVLGRDMAAGTLFAAALTPPFMSRACLYGAVIEPKRFITLAGPLRTFTLNWDTLRRVRISHATATIELEGLDAGGGKLLVRVREAFAGPVVYNALAAALMGKGESR